MSKQNKKTTDKAEKPFNKFLRVFRIVKNTIFGVILVALVGVLLVTLAAKINGETPTLFGYTLYRVSSGSMQPYLKVGDVILCQQCDPMKLEEGDVITYNGIFGQFAGKRVTHRVVQAPYYNEEEDAYYLLTKGDDNPVEDTPITVSQVTGKYLRKVDLIKKLYDFFLQPWGLLTIILLIILAFSNEIVIFAKALMGYGDEKGEDIQEIIERVQREDAEEQQRTAEKQQKAAEKKQRKAIKKGASLHGKLTRKKTAASPAAEDASDDEA